MKISLLLVALLGPVSICNAEPSPSVRYLMNEPVTLFDWGILRLHDYLDEYTFHYLKTNSVQDIYSTVSYDARRNKITISMIVTRQAEHENESPASVRKSSRDICKTVTQTLRREFLTDRDTHARRSSGIYRFFGHIGFKGKDEPIDSFDEIEKVTVINVSVYSDKDPGRLIVHSESPLMGKEILFGEGK
jgi:hypothetical protein